METPSEIRATLMGLAELIIQEQMATRVAIDLLVERGIFTKEEFDARIKELDDRLNREAEKQSEEERLAALLKQPPKQ